MVQSVRVVTTEGYIGRGTSWKRPIIGRESNDMARVMVVIVCGMGEGVRVGARGSRLWDSSLWEGTWKRRHEADDVGTE